MGGTNLSSMIVSRRTMKRRPRTPAAGPSVAAVHGRCLGRVLAVVLVALLASAALAATPGAVDRDGVALSDPGDAVADPADPSGVLVAQLERHLPRHHAG